MSGIIKEKKTNSERRIRELRECFANIDELKAFPNLAIFVAGSYARNEASIHSDIDMFFILDSELGTVVNNRTKKLRAFAKVIDEADKLKFPAFSNDGEYLEILEKPKIKHELGGRNDDHLNYFTARMLLLLESKCIFGEESYDEILRDIVGTYFRDYTHHPRDFRPIFLINDIIRFWKTLCLNYEHKRNQPDDNYDRRLKQKIKNFKLRFSRMLTCFASINAIINADPKSGADEIIKISGQSPIERMSWVVSQRESLKSHFDKLTEEYTWFLEQTNVSEADLLDQFRSKPFREQAFSRADSFGGSVFAITKSVAEETGYLRYLLI